MVQLQQALINALEKLSEKSPYRRELAGIISNLRHKDNIIPNTDYENITKFMANLVANMPGLLENNPDNADAELKELYRFCLNEVNVSENKSRRGF